MSVGSQPLAAAYRVYHYCLCVRAEFLSSTIVFPRNKIVCRRMLRFQLRRPKSTGNMIGYHHHSGSHIHDTIGSFTPSLGDRIHIAEEPSFTSATVHSFDSQQPLTVHDERRPSNFYIFDDDSTHEFDDEIQGLWHDARLFAFEKASWAANLKCKIFRQQPNECFELLFFVLNQNIRKAIVQFDDDSSR